MRVPCQSLLGHRFPGNTTEPFRARNIFQRYAMTGAPQRRARGILNALSPALQPIGTLKLGGITYEVPPSLSPLRLPHLTGALLDTRYPANLDNLHFLLQKYLLGQDVFLVSQPGPYARRLAMTFAR
jgi:hypothetical protein